MMITCWEKQDEHSDKKYSHGNRMEYWDLSDPCCALFF